MDETQNIIATTTEQLKTWEDYVQRLFEDDRVINHGVNEADTGPAILREEVIRVVHNMKAGKAPGPDKVHAELLKTLSGKEIDNLVLLFNKIYQTGKIPEDWLKSTFIPIPKKPNARRCEEYRTISLMSHILKLFLKIIHGRIFRKCEEVMADTQFGFRGGLGTRDALFAMQVLVQRCQDMNKDVYLCFIDYEKAFDRVQHTKMLEILKQMGLDNRDVRIIANLYWNQTANVQWDKELSKEVEVRRGVRQGCVLSPTLFNLYSEAILSEALDGCTCGLVVNGEVVNNLRYADDTVLLAGSADDLQLLLNHVNTTSNKYGLCMNVRKTKFMVVSRERVEATVRIAGKLVERVQSFKYLGCCVNEKWSFDQEVRSRIEQARAAFFRMRGVLCNRNLALKTRIRLLKCYIIPVLLYGHEGWTLTKALEAKLQAFELWLYRRILRISWTERVRNSEVLERIGTTVEVLYCIKSQKLQYFGHVMRNEKYRFLQLIMEGKIEGRRRPGRRKTSWLKNLREWFNIDSTSLFRAAVNRIQIALMIANLRRGAGI